MVPILLSADSSEEKDGGNIDRCYSAGSVSAPNTVGGLVGYNEQTVSNSYSSGSVSGSVAGGLVGENSWGGTVSNCYSTGAVTGSSSIGGLVGLENSGTVSNSFWDVTTSGLGSDGSPNGSAGGTGENTGHMKDQSTFTTSPANWDFTTPIWAINSSINSGYPYLVGVTDHPLPVEATSFVAKADVESVTLTWQTQSEVDNAGFNILREDAGTNLFAPIASYTSNDALKGMGTSATGRKYSFTDTKVKSGLTYQYKIQSVSTNGATKDLTTLSVTVDIPKNYALYQNYPNPFNPNSTIRFDLKETSTVTLEVYNVLGQRVEYWNYGTMDAGRYNENVNLDALASGVYFYKLVASGVEPTAVGNDGQKFTATKKLVLMK